MTITAVESSIQPISTVGAWWHPAPEVEPEPEPQAEPAKVIPLRREVDDPDARGTIWSLTQAQEMIRHGYHIRKVIAKTGWGANHLRDMVDDTGYYRPERI